MAWPTSAFPTGLDTITRQVDDTDYVLADDVNGAYDAIEHLQVKVGIDGSAVTTSLDYLLKNASSANPGHTHTKQYGASDITATAAAINDVCGGMAKDIDGTMAANSDARYATQKAIVTYACPKSHAVNASTYGYGDGTNAGHLRVGTGITVSTGTISVTYGTSAGTACVGNDSRLSDTRTPVAHQLDTATYHTVSGLTTGHFLKATGATTFGFAAHGLTYTDVSAAPTSHAANASTYGYGDGTNAGHLRVGTGLSVSLGTVSVAYGTSSSTACVGNDSRLSDSRTPVAHTLDGALHTVTGLTTGHFLKATGASSFGFAAHGLTYTDVSAAPTSHAVNASTYGYGDGTNAGHLRVGTGLTVSTGTVSVTYGTSAGTACVGNDSRLSDARTPTAHTHALSAGATDVTATAAELNIMHGVTSTTAELNILDGVTSTAAELNILDGVTVTAAQINQAVAKTSYTAGDVLVCSSDDMTSTGYGYYCSVKEMTIPKSGTVRVKFTIWSYTVSGVYGRIYKNDVAVGIERSCAQTPYEYTEDISVTAGDRIEICIHSAYTGAGTVYCSNFRIYASAADVMAVNYSRSF